MKPEITYLNLMVVIFVILIKKQSNGKIRYKIVTFVIFY